MLPTKGKIMNKVKFAVVAAMSLVCLNMFATEANKEVADQGMTADCSTMGPDVQQFASQLSASNKAMFCGQFTEVQRATAMQMVGQPDESGNLMTADQAVQKAGAKTPMNPSQKTPTGCPVK